MKKIMSLLLALAMVLSLAACGGNQPTEPTTEPTTAPTTAPTTEPTTAPTTEPTTEATEPAEGKEMISFSMSISVDGAPMNNLYISDNGDGTVFVEYLGEVRKISFAFDGAAMKVIADAVATLDLESLGEGVYEDGNKSCSLYVSYADYSMFMYDYMGAEIPAVFTAMMETMDAAFQTALAELEVYVPEMMVMEGIDANIQTEMLAIMNNSGIMNLDSLGAMAIPTDDAESFGYAAGLSSPEGITAAAVCQNMMMGGAAFQLVIVSLADESKAADVAADFEAKADFGKWVCVRPDQGLIAQKGNLVLCLLAPNDMFAGTADAIANAGWTTINTLTDPLAN